MAVTSHELQPSTLRPGALETSEWILEYRRGQFLHNDSRYGNQQTAGWWVNFNEDYQTIPVSLTFRHDRYGSVGYNFVQVPVPNVLLGFEAALTQCRKELIARADTKV